MLKQIKEFCLNLKNKDFRTLLFYRIKYHGSSNKPIHLKISGIEWDIPDIRSFLGMFNEIMIKKIYRFTPPLKQKDTQNHQVIIDFGANVGVSIFFFSKFYPSAEIYAYEADPEIFKYLKKNVERFGNSHIHLFNKAVSDKDGKLNFFQTGSTSGRVANKGEESIEIECKNASSILSEFDNIDFLKIDIEGSERYVIPSIATQLYKVSNIFLEYHSEINQQQCLLPILNCLSKFRLFISPGFCGRYPLFKDEHYLNYDNLLNIFGKKL